tara:strand:- start:13823 stop:16120 length:2298 start_codon:yes stop_codon:yes gene_type:complete
MATYDVTDQTTARRVQFTGNGTAGPFAFAFQVNATSEIKVYVDTTEKTETSHYTVSLNSGTGAGTISFTTGNHPTSSQTITILGDIPLSRTSVYTSGGQLTASSLEDDFDTNMFIHQQTNEEINRSLRQAEHDVISGADMTLPVKDTRKGTVLGFNATTGNPEAGPTITAVQSLADVTASINLLGTSAVVEDMGLLATSAVIEDMGLLATSSNLSAMALLGTSDVIADMALLGTSAVVEDMGFLGTSANITAMGLLGTSDVVADLALLGTSDVVADLAILATSSNVTNMATLGASGVVGNIATVAGQISPTNNISTVAGKASEITTVAGLSADIQTLSGISSDVTSLVNALASTTNYAVTVASGTLYGGGSGNVFYLDGTGNPALTLIRGNTYVFDQSDSSNATHPIAFRTSADASYTSGVTSTGTPGNAGAKTTFVVPSDAPSSLKYYCTTHGNGMGNLITVETSNINVVASNIGEVNSFAQRYRVGSSDPTASLDEGDLAYNTTANVLKYYNGSAWVTIVAGSLTDIVQDGTPQLGGDLDVVTHSIVSTSDRNIAITPNGSGKVVLDGLSYPTSDGSAGQFLKTDGAGNLSFASVELFPSGTSMLFQQTSAPTGWTKQTTHNDKALRIVTGSVGTGGTTAFSTALATPSVAGGSVSGNPTSNLSVSISGNISNTTLSINQIPSHSHNVAVGNAGSGFNQIDQYASSANTNKTSGASGGGGSHNHGHNLSGSMSGNITAGNLAVGASSASINVNYVDFIIANKD